MSRKNILIICANCVGIFLCMLDTTVMNIALPAIQKGLSVSLNNLQWAINVYTIIFATLTIPLSRLADRFGINRFYLSGMFIFLIGSILSGIATNLSTLIVGRAVQSIGAAIVFPLSMTIGISSVSLIQRTTVIAALGVTQGLAAALGPTIGGIITQFLSWRAIFLVNFPLLILAIILAFYSLDFKENYIQTKIDYLGSLLSMVTLFSLTLALVKGREWHWNSVLIMGLLAISTISLILFIITEKTSANPMLPLELFRDRQFTGSAVAIVLSNLFLVAVTVILPTYFTHIQNRTELQAALLITPISAMIFIFSPLAAVLVNKIGPRIVIATGFLLMGIAYVLFTKIDMTSLPAIITADIFLGIGYGIIAGPITVLAASNFTGTLLAASQSLAGVFRQIGIVLAVAIFVSGLYGNLAQAQKNSIKYSQQQIATLQVSALQRRKIEKHTIINIKKQQINTTTTKNHFSSAVKRELIQSNYQKIVMPNQQLPQSVKLKILQKITKKVNQKIKQLNQEINQCIVKIKNYSLQQYHHAFIELYMLTIPFVFSSMMVSILFMRKKDYLTTMQQKHNY